MNVPLKKIALYCTILCIVNLLSSCREAGAIATPKIIDTLSSKATVVRTVLIPSSQINGSLEFNGTNFALSRTIIPPTFTLLRMSDSTWRVSGSGSCDFRLGLTDADITIDTVMFRFAGLRRNSTGYLLSGDYGTQDSLASYTHYTILSDSVNTSNFTNENITIRRTSFTDNVVKSNLIITTYLNRGVVTQIDTVDEAGSSFQVFDIVNDRTLLSKVVAIKVTRKTIGTISSSKPFTFTKAVNANQVASAVVATNDYGADLMNVTLSFSSSGLSVFPYPVTWRLVFTFPLPQ
jgi:hypothetical protein